VRARLVGGGQQRGCLDQRLHAGRRRRGRGRACQRARGRAARAAAACRGASAVHSVSPPRQLWGQPIRADSCPRASCVCRGRLPASRAACGVAQERVFARHGVDAGNNCAAFTIGVAACTAARSHTSHTCAPPPTETGLRLPGSPPRETVRLPAPQRARCTADGSRLWAQAGPAGAAPVLPPGLASADWAPTAAPRWSWKAAPWSHV